MRTCACRSEDGEESRKNASLPLSQFLPPLTSGFQGPCALLSARTQRGSNAKRLSGDYDFMRAFTPQSIVNRCTRVKTLLKVKCYDEKEIICVCVCASAKFERRSGELQ